jgi:hypothetical protein
MIQYRGQEFQTRTGIHNVAGAVEFGGMSLEAALLNRHVEYTDERARIIDEQLYGFVPDRVLRSQTDSEFNEYINKHFD